MRITLCGSMSALEEMRIIASTLRTQGHEVALPDVDGEVKTKAERIQAHFEKVAWAEIVLRIAGASDAFPGW